MRITIVLALSILMACGAWAQAPEAEAEEGMFYVIGMGTTPDLLTLRGAAALEKCDVVLLENESDAEFWADLIEGKEVVIAYHAARYFYGVDPADLETPEQRTMAEQAARVRQSVVDRVAQAVAEGHTVGALQWGDAMMYGATWYLEMLPEEFPSEVIPGVGAMQAAAAAVKRNPVFGYDTNSVVVTQADFPGRTDLNEQLMETGTSLVVFTMHFDYPGFFEQLARHYPLDTPVAIVEWAGIPGMENVIRSTVGEFLSEVDYENLAPDAHLLLVGKFLECGQGRIDGLAAGQAYVERMHGGMGDVGTE